MTINSLLKQLPDMLEKIVSVLNKNGALGTGYCPLCGKQLVAVFYIYYSAASVLAIEYNFASTGMAAFKDMMSIAEFKSEFTYNLIMTIVFTLLGVGSYIFNLIRQTKRKSTINK